VNPDDHHVFVSLGGAAENLAKAALVEGLQDEVRCDATGGAVRVALSLTPSKASLLFQAISARQCTRGYYDGRPLSSAAFSMLERTGTASHGRVLLLTKRTAVERVLSDVIHSSTAHMADPAFVRDLRSWVRFNGSDAARTWDGLFGASSGNPAVPRWLGDMAFGWRFTKKGENGKIARQLCNSAGLAVFVGQAADKAQWVEVGRAYERFALQAAVLGIRNAFLNQPVEVAAVRSPFADAFGVTGLRPDRVVRFGRRPALPLSLRRPVVSVMFRNTADEQENRA
jgi:hypothetical protein